MLILFLKIIKQLLQVIIYWPQFSWVQPWWCPVHTVMLVPWSCCSQSLCWCPRTGFPLKAMWMSVGHFAAGGHVECECLCCYWGLWWCLWLMKKQMLTLLTHMVCAATAEHTEVCGSHWHQRPGTCPWSVTSLETTCESVIHVAHHRQGQAGCFAMVLMTAWSQWRKGA